jgi:hypothetical protein
MIKLKQILLEQQNQDADADIKMDVPEDKTGTIVRGVSKKDPWEYYFHDADGMWKTKRRTASKFLDMKTKLIRVYGEQAGNSRYETAQSRLEQYKNNPTVAAENKQEVITVVIPETQVEVVKDKQPTIAKTIHIDYDTQKVKEKMIDANGNRNKHVEVLAKTDDNKYLRVKLFNRGLFKRDIEVYVEASSFNVAADGKTAEYNGNEGKRYNLYKIK